MIMNGVVSYLQQNLIEGSLKTKTISALLFIKIVGPTLILFDPSKYVELWLLRGRHSAIDINSKEGFEKICRTSLRKNFGIYYEHLP